MKTIKVISWDDIPDNFTGIAKYLDGSKEWYKEGKLHREDGPAVENINGKKEWRNEGNLHRVDGPAVEWKDGAKQWHTESTLYTAFEFKFLIETSIFLGKEKGKYGLDWLRFLTEQGIKEFPVIPGMESYKPFACLFDKVFGVPIK